MKKIMIMISLVMVMMTSAFNNSDSYAMQIDGVWPNATGECRLFKYMDEERIGNKIVYKYRQAWLPVELADTWEAAIREEQYILNGGGNKYNYLTYLYKKYDMVNLMKKYGCN